MKTRFHFATTVITALLLVCVSACDPAYPIFVRNGLAMPVTTRVIYMDGVTSEAILQPGERLALLHPRGDIETIVILSGDHELYRLNKQVLAEMRTSVPDVRSVTWNIQSNGLVPLTKSQVEGLQSGPAK
jgi:hypothetical protein